MLAFAVGVRIVLAVVGLAVSDKPFPELLIGWDSSNYLRIAEVGYVPLTESPADGLFIVFYPLFPVFVALFGVVLPLAWSALVVNLFATAVAMSNIWFLGESKQESRRSVVLLVAFPTAFVLAIPYTEAVFLALTSFAALLHRRSPHSVAAAGSVAFASLARVTGVIAIPAYLWSVRKRARPGWMVLAGSGLAVYVLINVIVNGDPFTFLKVQSDHWNNDFAPFWVAMADAVSAVQSRELDTAFRLIFVGRLTAFFGGAALVIMGRRALNRFDHAFFWLGLCMMASASWLISMPRYLGGLYPLYPAAARALKNRWVFWLFTAACVVAQYWLFRRYVVGAWSI